MTTHSNIDKLAWIRLENGRVLCARSRGQDAFYLPGGKRERGETDEEALRREVEEELSVALKPETIAPYGTFQAQAHGKPEGVMVVMSCYTADYDGELRPAAEIEELAWLTYADRERLSLVGKMIFDELRGKNLLH